MLVNVAAVYASSINSDALNRLQSINFDKTGADTSNGTIHEAPNITYTYMTAGDKERIYTVASAGISTETYTYDTEGRVSNYKMSLTGRTSYPLETSYLYDTANRLTEVRYPKQYGMSGNPRKTVNVTYDQTSRLKDLKVNNSAQMDQISYNDFGQAISIRIGGGAANPLTEQYSFDANTGLMTNQKVKRGSTSIMDLSYYYARDLSKGSLNGKTGNLTKIVNNLDRNKDRKYEYDTLGRLIKAKGGVAAGGSGVANWTQTYTYDRHGNKTTTTKSGVTANSAAIPLDGLASQAYAAGTNRITTASHEYDNAGNMTRGKAPNGSIQRFEYDEAGRTIHIKADGGTTLETNTYGTSRERLKKEVGTTRTYYAWGGSSVIAEHVETGSETTMKWSKSYIYAGSRLLSTATKNGSNEKLEYHHPDRLGTKMVSDPVAASDNEQATLPFGTAIPAETQATTNQKFTSYDRSETTGLDYAVNRTYNSGQSRFTQVDPIGMASASIGDPQSLNLFAYVQNNPIDFVDPSGLIGSKIPDWVYDAPAGCEVAAASVTFEWTEEGYVVSNVERAIVCSSNDVVRPISAGGNDDVKYSGISFKKKPTQKDCNRFNDLIGDLKNEVQEGVNELNQLLKDVVTADLKTTAKRHLSNYIKDTSLAGIVGGIAATVVRASATGNPVTAGAVLVAGFGGTVLIAEGRNMLERTGFLARTVGNAWIHKREIDSLKTSLREGLAAVSKAAKKAGCVGHKGTFLTPSNDKYLHWMRRTERDRTGERESRFLRGTVNNPAHFRRIDWTL